jgi:hypothetical protein
MRSILSKNFTYNVKKNNNKKYIYIKIKIKKFRSNHSYNNTQEITAIKKTKLGNQIQLSFHQERTYNYSCYFQLSLRSFKYKSN